MYAFTQELWCHLLGFYLHFLYNNDDDDDDDDDEDDDDDDDYDNNYLLGLYGKIWSLGLGPKDGTRGLSTSVLSLFNVSLLQSI